MKTFIVGGMLLGLLLCPIGKAAVLRVVPPGTPGVTSAAPYDTWSNAASNIAIAIGYSSAGDTIVVSNGTYVLTGQLSISKDITLQSLNGAAVTTLDGNEATQVLAISHVDAIVDGFTITRGYYAGDGGGVRILGSGGTIQNCIISNNVAGAGGGLGLSHTGKARVIGCTITHNQAGNGGGFRVRDGGESVLQNCMIVANTATSSMGGIFDAGGCVVSNCTLLNNVSAGSSGGGLGGRYIDCRVVGNRALGSFGGGIGNPVWMERCVIASNTCATTGGGISLQSGKYASNCVFFANAAGTHGGGVYFSSGGDLYDSQVYSNTAASNGGGVYGSVGGKLQNCLLHSNRSEDNGGGALLDRIGRNGGAVISCTVAGNQAASNGGGLFLSKDAEISVTNTIIAHNSIDSGTTPNLYAFGANTKAFWHCCADYGSFEPGQGNITSDPLFVDAENGDYRLKRASLCIDAGTNLPWMADALDLAGNARIDSPDDLGLVDIGCFEYRPVRGVLLLLR